MRAFERAEITTIELPDELQFAVIRHAGWAERFGAPVAVAATALWLWFSGQEVFSLLIAAIGGISLVANWVRGQVTKLRVTETEFVGRGNLDQFFSTEARAQASEVTSIGYEMGSENGPSGLYARTGWSHTCLLPGLNEEQANAIAAAVSKRFPEIPAPDLTPASVLFGDESGVTTIGISASKQGDVLKGDD
jgi:hypothetical protein